MSATLYTFDSSDTALVVGLGKSGLACVEVLSARGVTLYATDEKPRASLADAISYCADYGAVFIDPSEIAAVRDQIRYVVLSPGVPLTSPVMRELQSAAIPVLSEIEVAYRLCAAPMIAVTGTKGKSTTSALIAHLLRSVGYSVKIGGNIGNPLIREAVAAQANDWIVAEISSFQLETISRLRPRVAVLLNIAPDHLDRYESMDAYARAKYRIFANQSESDTFIGDLDDARVASLRDDSGAVKIPAHARWFTTGAWRVGVAMYLERDAIMYVPPELGAATITIAHRSDIPLAGEHNVRNVMAASLAALAVGVDSGALLAGIRSFTVLSHRLETLVEIEGIRFVDDSKSTNPSSVIAALRAYDRPIVLIAGGRAKGSSFSAMGAEIRERAKALVLIGEASDDIAAHAAGVTTVQAVSMNDAVQRARELAQAGDVVLLSPGCASFDMFTSAEDRGARFAQAVESLRGVSRA